jgi:hypothetical protein
MAGIEGKAAVSNWQLALSQTNPNRVSFAPVACPERLQGVERASVAVKEVFV